MRRVLTLGGGPAGLYASLLLKRARPDLDITLTERNPPDATYGWGVVFSDRTLSEFREADQPSYEEILDRFVLWDAIDIRYRDEIVRSGGHVFAGIARVALLGILQRRCREVGVDLRFGEEVTDLSALAGYDLVIAADGVNSIVRTQHDKVFRPRLETGSSRYVWFGSSLVLDSFTFIFRQNEHGLFQVHAYPFDGQTCTFIVETDEATWRRAGLDRADEAESIRYCQRLFDEELRGARLLGNRSQWIGFVTLRTRSWHHDNMVLLGDAAHTAHFSIGSGTKLAMEDAISLARALDRHGDDLEAGLAYYEQERKPVVERFQDAAEESRTYFENTRRYAHLEPMPFAFHLLTRSGRIDYATLRIRDPRYVDQVDRTFAGRSVVAPPPLLATLSLRGLELPNRVVVEAGPVEDAVDGVPGPGHRERLVTAGAREAGLVLAETVAVSEDGRITPASAGLYRDDQADVWRSLIDEVHGAGGRVAVRLGHAGARGATRPRRHGVDRPLRDGGWPLLAASPVPYSPSATVPGEMTDGDMQRVVRDFVGAAERAAAAGADLLLVHMAHGYLLSGFLSPLTNARSDRYGGSLEDRMRLPLEVLEAVRAAWPAHLPLGATVQASDWAPGGWQPTDAVALVRALRDRGCDLVEPLAGQTVPASNVKLGRGFLVPYADVLRNEAGVPVLVGGGITATDQANTILAGGRADLVVLRA